MMRKLKLLVLLFVVSATCIFGQYKKHFVEGNLLVLEENYGRALQEFQKAYSYDSTNANINFKLGFCYLKHATEKHRAEEYLEKAIKDVSKNYDEENPMEKSSPPMAYLYLGMAFHLDYKFDDALKMYDTYESYLNPKRFKEEVELVEHYKTMVHHAQERVATPANVQITNMGDSINSQYSEISPVLSADERMLIFTYAGPLAMGSAQGNKTPDDGYFEDIFVCYKKPDGTWTTPDTLSTNVNSWKHDGAVGLTPDGQTLIIYKDDNGDGNLYYSNWDGSDWSMPIKYGPEINSTSWEPSACLSPDGNTLYFVSNRPGGFGGRDIYRCRKLPNGRWSQAQNLGPKINTKYDEESPFVHPNGEDFFFSSQGHASMGGFDIMVSIIDSAGGFSDVYPLPYPINTTDDDEFYTSSPDNKRAYYASSHEDRSGYGLQDIYMITIGSPTEEADLGVLFVGKIIPSSGDTIPHNISIIVTNKVTGEQVGTYRPQKNGNFTSILKPNNTYVFSYQIDGKEFYMEEIAVGNDVNYQEIDREVPLKSVTVGPVADKLLLDVIVLNNQKEKQAVGGSTVTITSKDGKSVDVVADANGKVSAYELKKDNSYKIVATADGKKSEAVTLSTVGVASNSTFSRTLFIGKATNLIEVNPKASNITLNLLVLELKKMKPVSGAKITITDEAGVSFELNSDDQGKSSNISLESGKIYTVVVSNGELSGKPLQVSTKGITGTKKISKTLYVPGTEVSNETDPVRVPVEGSFVHHFTYNKTEVEKDPEYENFLKSVEDAITKNGSVTLKIHSCASQVPTRVAGGNAGLAKSRANNLKRLVEEYLASRGIDKSKAKIMVSSRVGGPTYNSDYLLNKAKYEKYQYVEAKIIK